MGELDPEANFSRSLNRVHTETDSYFVLVSHVSTPNWATSSREYGPMTIPKAAIVERRVLTYRSVVRTLPNSSTVSDLRECFLGR